MKDLVNIADEKNYEVNEDYIEINNNIFINGVKDVRGYISFYYDDNDDLSIDYHLEGSMICPDSMTLENVDVPFDIEDDERVVTKQGEDGFYFIDNMDIKDFVVYIIIPEVPIKVEKKGETMYYSGDGWTILSEEEYNKASKNKIDPRLEKILEYKEED